MKDVRQAGGCMCLYLYASALWPLLQILESVRMKQFVAVGLMCVSLSCAGRADAGSAIAVLAQFAAVTVSGNAQGESKKYRDLFAGIEAFEHKHGLAPAATGLRFILLPKPVAGVQDGAALRIVGRTVSIAVPVADDGGFTLPRDQSAYDDNADLVWNRGKGLMGFVPEVRSANVPPQMRRLGDLRLECEVAMAIAKRELNFAWRASISAALGSDWCRANNALHNAFQAPAWFDRLTLIDGARRLNAQVGRRQKSFAAPVNDPTWSDDTLIEFAFSPAPDKAVFGTELLYLRGSMNQWGTNVPLKSVGNMTFSADLALPLGRIEFKLGSADFRVIDLGASGNSFDLTATGGAALAWDGRNLAYSVDQPGVFRFSLHVQDAAAPWLTVARLE